MDNATAEARREAILFRNIFQGKIFDQKKIKPQTELRCENNQICSYSLLIEPQMS